MPTIDAALRRWCEVCQQATVSAVCNARHAPYEYCTAHEKCWCESEDD